MNISPDDPHPLHLCNNHIKFDQFLEMADGLGAAQVATGHYARIDFDEREGRWRLRRGIDLGKDQTYFLFGIRQEQLARTLFPLGAMTKPEVRALAAELGIGVAAKQDSQEICFVPNGDYAAFIDAYFREKGIDRRQTAGEIVNTEGEVIGEHAGVHHFTVGQRKGIGIAAPEPLYVISTEPLSQRVIVGGNDELLRATLVARDVNWVSIAPSSPPPAAPRSKFATATNPPPPRFRQPPTRTVSRSASIPPSAPSPPARLPSSTMAIPSSAAAG